MKNSHERILLLVKLQALPSNFIKSDFPPWVFLTSFKIVEMALNRTKHLNEMFLCSQNKFLIACDWILFDEQKVF